MAEKEKEKIDAPITLSINRLMELFREAIVAVLPELEKAQVVWENFDDYEEVETICESLFNLIVKYKLEEYISEKYNFTPKIPQYGFYLKNYTDYDPIGVKVDDSDDIYTFVLIESKEEAFDTIMCDKLDENGNIISRENEFKWDDVDFIFSVKNKD